MPRRVTPTVVEAIDQYMRSRSHLASSTALNDRSVLRGFARAYGQDRRIGYLTEPDVERFFVAIGDTQKPASFNKVRQRVGCFLAYCRRHGWIKEDLMAEIRPRRVPHIERLQLSARELVRFLDVPTDPRERAFLATAINTGLRSSEITRLRVKDVDFQQGELYVFRPKNSQDDRIPLTPAHERELRDWLTTYTQTIGGPLHPEMYLYPARRPPRYSPGKHQAGRQVQELGALRPDSAIVHAHRIVQRNLQRFGIETTTQEGLHTVRRSVARAFFESASNLGYDAALRATATLLGHKSTVTTEIYLGLSADRRKRDAIMRDQDFLPFSQPDAVIALPMSERVSA